MAARGRSQGQTLVMRLARGRAVQGWVIRSRSAYRPCQPPSAGKGDNTVPAQKRGAAGALVPALQHQHREAREDREDATERGRDGEAPAAGQHAHDDEEDNRRLHVLDCNLHPLAM